jgi:hypothetical protein
MNSFLRHDAAIVTIRRQEGAARRDRGLHHPPYADRRRDHDRA